MEADSTMKLLTGISVVALFLGPVLAVIVGYLLQERKKLYDVKKNIFLNLIAYRGNQVHQTFVNSLNMIDFVFRKDKDVIQAWHKHRDNLSVDKLNSDHLRISLLNLLAEMTDALGYKKLRQTSFDENYLPNAHVEQAIFDQALKENLVGYLKSGKEIFEYLKKESDKKKTEPMTTQPSAEIQNV